MCGGLVCGIVTVAVGSALVVASCLVGFFVVPNLVENTIINQVILVNDTDQMERFQEVPFPITFGVRVFNISNAEQVLEGSVPMLTEIGPYVYNMYQRRLIEGMEDDKLRYRIILNTVFDKEASYPLTEDDVVHVANVAYHGVLQVAETILPGMMGVLNLALPGIFGDRNGPIMEVRVGDLLFEGMDLCRNPGVAGSIACVVIRGLTDNIQNMDVQPDNSIKFSVFGYRENRPGKLYEIYRGIDDHNDLGRIMSLNGNSTLPYWVPLDVSNTYSDTDGNDTSGNDTDGNDTDDNGNNNSTEPVEPRQPSVCELINGTDSGIFAPFVDNTKPLYALNTDICRSVELRYQYDTDYKGIPVYRFSANEWFLDNEDGCFCMNVTTGITAPDGCLLRGAQELYTCVGAYMVLTYPHFLYADMRYRNNVMGLNPIEENHRIFLDLEPNTGTVVRGAKRAQFNVFMRAIDGVPATQNLRTTLTPILWLEEGIELSDEYVDLIKNDVVSTLSLINILVPVVVALSAAVLLAGIGIVLCVKIQKKKTV